MKISIFSSIGREVIVIPDRWEAVTTEKYQKLYSEWDASDVVKLFSILTGQDYQTLFDTVNPDLERKLIDCTKFVSKQEFKESPIPRVLKIKERDLIVPKRLGGLSIGQSIHVRQKMDSVKVSEELISYAAAIYLQPLYDRSGFNHDSAVELEKEILKMPITEIYPIGFFLLKRLQDSGSSFMSKVRSTFTRFIHLSLRNESR